MERKMWVATDVWGAQQLFQGCNKPWRENWHWTNGNDAFVLNPKPFPDQTFNDEPIEVELVKRG